MHWRRAFPVLMLVGLAVAILGCGRRIDRLLLPNENPEVRFGPPRVVASTQHSRTYSIRWDASDMDGRISHVLVALDPPSLDPSAAHWTRTTTNSQLVTIDEGAAPDGFHRFVVRAADDRGGASEPAMIALGAGNLPPEVRITCPIPGAFVAFVAPSVRISWSGLDPDGVFTTKPVKYKYILLSASSEFPKDLAVQQPDSLRRYYVNHPNGPWAGWDSTSAETTQVQFTNLTPGSEYVFTVIGFDEVGAYSPLFDFTTNMITLRVGFAGMSGPRITMWNEYFNYTYATGGYFNDAAHHVRLEVPGGAPVPIRWFASPSHGACDLRTAGCSIPTASMMRHRAPTSRPTYTTGAHGTRARPSRISVRSRPPRRPSANHTRSTSKLPMASARASGFSISSSCRPRPRRSC